MTATNLNNLAVVTVNGVAKTRWEHAGYKLPKWCKSLQTFGKAGTVKDGKRGKVLDQGVTMMFIGYAEESAADSYRMFNPLTGRVSVTRDVIWLGRMYYPRLNANVTKLLPVEMVPVTQYSTDGIAVDDNTEIITDGPSLAEKSGEVVNNDEGWITQHTRYG